MQQENLEGWKENLKTNESLNTADEWYSMTMEEWESGQRKHLQDIEFA